MLAIVLFHLGAKLIQRPKHAANVTHDHIAGNGADRAGIVAVAAVIAHNEILVLAQTIRAQVGAGLRMRVDVRLVHQFAIDIHRALDDLQKIPRQGDQALDKQGVIDEALSLLFARRYGLPAEESVRAAFALMSALSADSLARLQ